MQLLASEGTVLYEKNDLQNDADAAKAESEAVIRAKTADEKTWLCCHKKQSVTR